MIFIENIKKSFNGFLVKTFSITEEQARNCDFELNIDESKKEFGDINSNAALILAKQLKKNPKDIANTIINQFSNKNISKIEMAGPGFINIYFTNQAFIEILKELYELKDNFFKPEFLEKKYNYSIEFVSANPTGPLHIGHGRGGIIGDVLGNILKFIGHNTTKEFYINDEGKQIKKLGLSLKIRCQQLLNVEAKLPEDAYQGEYLIDLAKECINSYGKDILTKPDEFFEKYAKNKMLQELKTTLEDYGIYYDVWFSEHTLHEEGKVKGAIEKLIKSGNTYEKDNALWFRSTEFGDDKDRVLRKADGELTYIAADIAYMQSKIDRGADYLIMVLGQDHHSYVVRLHGIQKAMGLEQYPLDVILYQLVKMKESGQLVRMSKRAGRIITLRDIIDTVGKDVARFFYLNRKADAQLEFDIDLALKKTEENPVYYIQYAYVRTNSILDKAKEANIIPDQNNIDFINNIDKEEYYLIKKIVSLKLLLESIAKSHQTHALAYYLIELSTIFHRYYAINRIIDTQNIEKTKARLLLTGILKNTFEMCLKLLGISRPQKM